MGAEDPARADLPGRHPAVRLRPRTHPRRDRRGYRLLAESWPRGLAEGAHETAPGPRLLGGPRLPPGRPGTRDAIRRSERTPSARGLDAEALALPRTVRGPSGGRQAGPPRTGPAADRSAALRGGGLGDRMVRSGQGRHGHRADRSAREHREPGPAAGGRRPRRRARGRRGPAARPAARPPVRRRARPADLRHRHQQHPTLPFGLVLRPGLPGPGPRRGGGAAAGRRHARDRARPAGRRLPA